MSLQKSRKRHRSPTKTSAASSASSPPAASSPPVASSSAASSSSSASLPPPPPPPSPPSPSPSVFTEDPMFPLVDFYDFVDDNLINFYWSQWSSIRTNRRSGRIQSTYNIRLTDLNTSLHHTLWNIFKTQSSAFKINLRFGFILRNKISGELRYFHSSKNVSGRFLDAPHLITDVFDFQTFLESFVERDILSWAILQRPNSEWICELVTNATFYLNFIHDHPIGCPQITLPDYMRNNPGLNGLVCDLSKYGKPSYSDNLCFFRALALSRGADMFNLETHVKVLYTMYKQPSPGAPPMNEFTGFKLSDLYTIEKIFHINIYVYELINDKDNPLSCHLIRRSMCKNPDTLNLNLYKTNFSYIPDLTMYTRSFKCKKCGKLFHRSFNLNRHEQTCEVEVKRVFPGGVFHVGQTVFQKMREFGIHVSEELRFYPFRATFDFECYFDNSDLPPNSPKVDWLARHEILSVSTCSNVPGFILPCCFINEGDPNQLVDRFMNYLDKISNAAYNILTKFMKMFLTV